MGVMDKLIAAVGAVKNPKSLSFETKVLLLFAVPIALVILIHYILTGFIIYNDGTSYYSYARSLIIDRDLNFTNEWSFYNTSYSRFSSEPRGINAPTTSTPKGYPENIYLIGNSVMWLPFFLAAHAAAMILSFLGLPVNADGYSWPYEIAIGIASLIYGFLAMLLIYRFCRKWFDNGTSLLATISIWYGTAAFWYNAIEPSLAHVNSIFLNALFVYFWHNTLGKRTKLQWALLGIILGFVFLVRQQDVLIGLLAAFELAKNVLKAATDGLNKLRLFAKNIANAAVFGIGILAMVFQQMLVWKKMFGSFIIYTHSSLTKIEPTLYWTSPQLVPLFFSADLGMWRVPLMLLALVGTFVFALRARGVAWYFLVVVVAQLLLTASWSGWVNGYGIRLLLGLSVFFALGAAEIIDRLKRKISSRWVYAVIAALVAANFVNMTLVLMAQVTSKTPITEIIRIILNLIR